MPAGGHGAAEERLVTLGIRSLRRAEVIEWSERVKR